MNLVKLLRSYVKVLSISVIALELNFYKRDATIPMTTPHFQMMMFLRMFFLKKMFFSMKNKHSSRNSEL